MNLTWHSARRAANDRHRWRNLVAGQREEKHALQTLYVEEIVSTSDGKEPEASKNEPNQNPGFARTKPNRNSKVKKCVRTSDLT